MPEGLEQSDQPPGDGRLDRILATRKDRSGSKNLSQSSPFLLEPRLSWKLDRTCHGVHAGIGRGVACCDSSEKRSGVLTGRIDMEFRSGVLQSRSWRRHEFDAAPRKPPPTYHKDVARILQKNCQDCHRPRSGGAVRATHLRPGPEARHRHCACDGRADDAPWPASSTYGGPFRDARVLTTTRLPRSKHGSTARCPEGDPNECPPRRTFTSAWPLGEPDLTLTMPEPYTIAAAGARRFSRFRAQDESARGSLDSRGRLSAG